MKVLKTVKQLLEETSGENAVNVIYGAGWMGKIVYQFLTSKGVIITAFVETQVKEEKRIGKIPVLGLSQILNQSKSPNLNIILAVKESRYREQMEEALKKKNYISYSIISELLQYAVIQEIIKLDAKKVYESNQKNKSQKTVGYLNTTYLGADYAHKRLIIDCIDDVSYVELPWETADVMHMGNQLEDNHAGYMKTLLEACYQPEICTLEADLIHTMNTVCAIDRPWIASFETTIPRLWFQTEQEKDYYLHLIDCMKAPNCRAIYALCQNAYEIQENILKSHISPDDVKLLMEKTKVLHPPQKILITEEEFERKHDTQKIHFIFCGRAFFMKGGREVVRSLSKFEGRYEFKLTLISSLLYDDFFTSTSYEEMVIYRNLIKEKSWIDYYESLPNEMVLEKCREATVGLLPSFGDTYGYAVLEMQAAGCPVITSNIRAFSEMNGEECGWMCQLPIDRLKCCTEHNMAIGSSILEEELTKCFQDIFDHPEMIKNKGRKALERVRRMHDPERYQNELKRNLF